MVMFRLVFVMCLVNCVVWVSGLGVVVMNIVMVLL